MEIRVLRYFLTVAREESIHQAAEVLHITQPTLSRQLSQLEDEVGVKLFHRGSRKITLTNEGILLRRRGEEILSLVDRTEQELIEQDELAGGRIVIGSGELAAVQVLSDIIASFHQKYPLVSFDLFTANADLVKEHMEKGLVDIGVLLEPIDIEKFAFIRLQQKERWVVVMRADDPLAAQTAIRPEDLTGRPLILPRRPNVQNELHHWFGGALHDRQVLLTSNLSTNGTLLVQKGLGYSIVIEGSLPFLDKQQIVCRPLDPELTASCVFAWKRQMPLSLATAKFIDHIQCFLGIANE